MLICRKVKMAKMVNLMPPPVRVNVQVPELVVDKNKAREERVEDRVVDRVEDKDRHKEEKLTMVKNLQEKLSHVCGVKPPVIPSTCVIK